MLLTVECATLLMDYYFTKERLKQLEEEVEQLKTGGRQEVSDELRSSKELGDLKENAQYIEAKEAQQKLEKKINELEQMIRNAVIIDDKRIKKDNDEVQVGSTVEVSKNGEKKEFYIVGSNEANPQEGFISNESPIGQALVGSKEGDEISLETPKGSVKYKVLKIS